MALFLSTFTMKVDKKGRVSVPAPFRAAVDGGSFKGVVVYRALKGHFLEGADLAYLEDLSQKIYSDFGPFDDDQMAVATAILAGASQLPFDGDGRVLLPPDLKEFAGIEDQATFAGIGHKFQVWNPAAFEAHKAAQLPLAPKAAAKLTPFPPRGQS